MIKEKELKPGVRFTWDGEYAIEDTGGVIHVFPLDDGEYGHRTKNASHGRTVFEVIGKTGVLVQVKIRTGAVTDSFFLPTTSVLPNCTLIAEGYDIDSILSEGLPHSLITCERSKKKEYYTDGSVACEVEGIADVQQSASEEKVGQAVEELKVFRKEIAGKQGVKLSDYLASGINVKNDKVSHPSHYTWLKDLCGIEVIDITRHMDFDLGNCLKYLLRAGHKKEQGYTGKEKTLEDLRKAAWYLDDKIKMLENEK